MSDLRPVVAAKRDGNTLEDDEIGGFVDAYIRGEVSDALAASFLTLAIVMGEFTIANLSAFHTFPIFIQYVNESQGFPAGALTLVSFGITWAAMLSLLFVGTRRGTRQPQIAGAR